MIRQDLESQDCSKSGHLSGLLTPLDGGSGGQNKIVKPKIIIYSNSPPEIVGHILGPFLKNVQEIDEVKLRLRLKVEGFLDTELLTLIEKDMIKYNTATMILFVDPFYKRPDFSKEMHQNFLRKIFELSEKDSFEGKIISLGCLPKPIGRIATYEREMLGEEIKFMAAGYDKVQTVNVIAQFKRVQNLTCFSKRGGEESLLNETGAKYMSKILTIIFKACVAMAHYEMEPREFSIFESKPSFIASEQWFLKEEGPSENYFKPIKT